MRLSVNGFLCAFEIPVPGSPTSVTSPAPVGERDSPLFLKHYLLFNPHKPLFLIPSFRNVFSPGNTLIGNGIARNSHAEKPGPVPNGTAGTPVRSGSDRSLANGIPSTLVPSGSEKSLANGIPNGHATPVQDSPFIGYIIAMHRKMVTSADSTVSSPLTL